jgi:hypothetical protein
MFWRSLATFSIRKSLTSHSTKGKSLAFLLIVWTGYLAGVVNKILNQLDIVIIFYIINMSMVTIDTLLFLRNKRINNQPNGVDPVSIH